MNCNVCKELDMLPGCCSECIDLMRKEIDEKDQKITDMKSEAAGIVQELICSMGMDAGNAAFCLPDWIRDGIIDQ